MKEIAINTNSHPNEIADRLKNVAAELFDIALYMDYYGGFAVWASSATTLARGSTIIKHLAESIEEHHAKTH